MKLSTFLTVILLLISSYIFSSCTMGLSLGQTSPSPKGGFFKDLSVRVFDIDGGVIAYQVFASNTQGKRRHPVLSPYPTTYHVKIKNASGITVYSVVEWKFTNKDTIEIASKKIPPDHYYRVFRGANDLTEEVKLPLRITIFSDMGHSNKIGEVKTSIFVGQYIANQYRKKFGSIKRQIVGGLLEINTNIIKSNVPGASGDHRLQRDIQFLLWKEESKKRPDCEREALKAKKGEIGSSILLSSFPVKLKETTVRLVDKDLAYMEIWNIRSCDTESSYEVLMVKHPVSGTNIMTKLIE